STCFPGRLVSFETGSDNHHTYCFVRFFPLQYIPNQEKAVLVTDAIIDIYYNVESHKKGHSKSMGSERNVIIYPQEFHAQAESLKNFHDNELVIPTALITTEWISANYDTAEKPDYSGYSSNQPSCIQDYNFTLARKIITYLRDTPSHPNLEYVTLLGDAEKIPPSYYFALDPEETWADYWSPTDFLYASPDYDFVPNYGIGRISVSNTIELAHVVTKIKDWYPADWSWFQNVVIPGGNPFPDWL
ncbi:unnamed protein product, partial [marine sediment metagenome]